MNQGNRRNATLAATVYPGEGKRVKQRGTWVTGGCRKGLRDFEIHRDSQYGPHWWL
jgi:hypothetical protein